MENVAVLSNTDRNDLFAESANQRNVAQQIIEKDFWVCWVLKTLFELPEISPHLIFKGGTSLSKVYGVIERFSEDVDVSINREYLGFKGETDPLNLESKKRQKDAVEAIKAACSAKVQNELIKHLADRVIEKIGDVGWELSIDPNDPDGQTLLFQFPRVQAEGTSRQPKYVQPIIRIELGARAEHQPSEVRSIRPYIADDFPDLLTTQEFDVKVLAAERTFWEKATILHDQHHRASEAATADRISRHYYDLHRLNQTEIVTRAMSDLGLLRDVVRNKMTFFPRAGARYEEVLEGELRLSPNNDRLKALRSDYEKMGEMFFAEVPDFDAILEDLAHLERTINAKIKEAQ